MASRLTNNLAVNLRIVLASGKITKDGIVVSSGLTFQQFGNILNRTTEPTLEMVASIAFALDCDPCMLLEADSRRAQAAFGLHHVQTLCVH